MITRRRFLRSSAALATAAPFALRASVSGAATVAPSNRITVGFIGVGQQGLQNVKSFLYLPDAQVVAVCDVDRKRLQAAVDTVNAHYGNTDCRAYTDFRGLLARPDIDAGGIATQEHWHAIQAMWACRAGKDVYCQKPLALTVPECRAVVNAARRYDRVFQVGTQNRSNPQARLACELVRNGHLGELQFAELGTWATSKECQLPAEKAPDYLDWDMWLGPAPWRPYHPELHRSRGWMPYRDYSGGGVTDVGAHFFDLALWALGREEPGPITVGPLNPAEHDGREVCYRNADGLTLYRRSSGNYLKFVGTRAEIQMDVCAWVKTTAKPQSLLQTALRPGEVRLEQSTEHFANFIQCVRTRREPVADVEHGARAATLCHIGNIAQWLNRPLRWDRATESFGTDAEANRMLSRATREPWHI